MAFNFIYSILFKKWIKKIKELEFGSLKSNKINYPLEILIKEKGKKTQITNIRRDKRDKKYQKG